MVDYCTLALKHSTFVFRTGNSQRPSLLQTELVNIYLFSATSQTVLLSKLNETNPEGRAGLIHEQVNDTWFGDRGRSWNGKNQTFLYYWVITPNTESLDNRIVPQTTFAAVRECSHRRL